MRNDATVKVEARGEREILITRDFKAPAQVVFEAWTKPEHVRHWRGCFGSTMTACEIDLRPAGPGATSCACRMAASIRSEASIARLPRPSAWCIRSVTTCLALEVRNGSRQSRSKNGIARRSSR